MTAMVLRTSENADIDSSSWVVSAQRTYITCFAKAIFPPKIYPLLYQPANHRVSSLGSVFGETLSDWTLCQLLEFVV